MLNKNKVIMLSVILLLFCLYCSSYIISEGEIAILTKFGRMYDIQTSTGLHIANPISVVKIFNYKKVENKYNFDVYTSDLQDVQIIFSIFSQVNKDKIEYLYKNYDINNYEKSIIEPTITEILKTVIGKYTSEDLILKRQEISDLVNEKVKEASTELPISIFNFKLIDIDYYEEFEKAIMEKQIAIEKAKKVENETKMHQEQAKQKVIDAEAEAKALKIKSDALKTNNNLIQLEIVNKWNGELPKTYSGESPFSILIKN